MKKIKDDRKWKGHPKSGMIPMPEGFVIHNGGYLCDMAAGPCSCGAGHSRAGWIRKANDALMGYSKKEKDVFLALVAAVDELDKDPANYDA